MKTDLIMTIDNCKQQMNNTVRIKTLGTNNTCKPESGFEKFVRKNREDIERSPYRCIDEDLAFASKSIVAYLMHGAPEIVHEELNRIREGIEDFRKQLKVVELKEQEK